MQNYSNVPFCPKPIYRSDAELFEKFPEFGEIPVPFVNGGVNLGFLDRGDGCVDIVGLTECYCTRDCANYDTDACFTPDFVKTYFSFGGYIAGVFPQICENFKDKSE